MWELSDAVCTDSSCGMQVQEMRHMGKLLQGITCVILDPWLVNQLTAPCIARQVLYHWATRKSSG